jgi:hypothetical protein
MVTTLFTGRTKAFICKQMSKLPPVVSDWQQCQQPQCSHYCDGMCSNPSRQSASARCPFDDMELPLVDAESVDSDDADLLRSFPENGLIWATDELRWSGEMLTTDDRCSQQLAEEIHRLLVGNLKLAFGERSA